MVIGLYGKKLKATLANLTSKMKITEIEHMYMRIPRVHSHLVAFGKRSLSIGYFSGRSFVSKIKVASERLPRNCCLENDFKTVGLLLRRPNIALVIVRPFRIDP